MLTWASHSFWKPHGSLYHVLARHGFRLGVQKETDTPDFRVSMPISGDGVLGEEHSSREKDECKAPEEA